MAKVEILVTINDGCDPCWNSKNKIARRSVTSLTMGSGSDNGANEKTWHFCEEHRDKFSDYFTKTFGEGETNA